MAIAKEIWEKIRVQFESGMSLKDIELDSGINKGTISKKAKKENWEKNKIQPLKADIVDFEEKKATLDNQKGNLIERVAKLSDFEITVLNEIIEDETRISSLITSTSSLALIRTNQMLTKGTKQVPMKVKEYHEGRAVGESYEFIDTQLEPKDLKEITESIDKASITLGVNQRHANTQINNTNAQQNNTVEDKAEISKAIADGLPD